MPFWFMCQHTEKIYVYWQPFCYTVRHELPIIEHKIHVYTWAFTYVDIYNIPVIFPLWIQDHFHSPIVSFLLLLLFAFFTLLPGYFILIVIHFLFHETYNLTTVGAVWKHKQFYAGYCYFSTWTFDYCCVHLFVTRIWTHKNFCLHFFYIFSINTHVS